MSIDGGSGRDEMTLVFSQSAIERLEDPGFVFEDARTWSRFVAIIDNDLESIEKTVAKYDLQQDFDLDDNDIWYALEGIRQTTLTPRHVYVGTSEDDRRMATHLGWEYLHVSEAAEKADWPLSGEGSNGGIVTRFLRAIPGKVWPLRPP